MKLHLLVFVDIKVIDVAQLVASHKPVAMETKGHLGEEEVPSLRGKSSFSVAHFQKQSRGTTKEKH